MDTTKLTEQENYAKASELKDMASKWVQEFNFIQVDILNMVSEKEGSYLGEFIRQPEITFSDVAEYSNLDAKQLKRKYKNVEDCPEYETTRNEREQSNYPMWNTCFEFKSSESEEVIQAAIDAGCGVIEGLGDFNTILFFAGAGYSFYGSHWIPLFLNLPWNKELKVKYKDVYYKNM